MDADFSVELGHEDPVLDFPWHDPLAKFAYIDVKRHPERVVDIEEALRLPELRDFLSVINSATSSFETAKCDAWATIELTPEEEIYGGSSKFASYVDVVFSDPAPRLSFPIHELFARRLVESLRSGADISASMEVCVRRCYFREGGESRREVREGFYCTLYVNGYGSDEALSRANWSLGLRLLAHAMVQ